VAGANCTQVVLCRRSDQNIDNCRKQASQQKSPRVYWQAQRLITSTQA
jgi:hypothetical protein